MTSRSMRFRDWVAVAVFTTGGIFMLTACGWLLSLIVTGRAPTRWHADPAVIPAKIVQYSLGIFSGVGSLARAYTHYQKQAQSV